MEPGKIQPGDKSRRIGRGRQHVLMPLLPRVASDRNELLGSVRRRRIERPGLTQTIPKNRGKNAVSA